MAGIYIHIPFCRKACHYCNFHFSTTLKDKEAVINAIALETELQRNYLNEPVETIYFGGGTPSLLNEQELQKLLSGIKEHFEITASAEITLEANPDDINETKLARWKEAGINRLSIGIQSFYEKDLQWMNRAHNAAQAKQSILLAQAAGYNNITIDLIYGTPGLTDEEWINNIETAFSLNVPHLSCYALTVEQGTVLSKMIEQNKKESTDEEKQQRHFQILIDKAATAGFEHYEISNFAKPGFLSRHNSSYWSGKSYLGLGPSAHSFKGNTRQWNISNNALYVKSIEQNIVPFEMETLTPVQQLNEYIMTALRTSEGISLKAIQQKWNSDDAEKILAVSTKYIKQGLAEIKDGNIILTSHGKFYADGIAADMFFE